MLRYLSASLGLALATSAGAATQNFVSGAAVSGFTFDFHNTYRGDYVKPLAFYKDGQFSADASSAFSSGSATAATFAGGTVSTSVDGSNQGLDVGTARAAAVIAYQFEIIGPTQSVHSVPVTINAFLGAAGYGSRNNYAAISISYESNSFYYQALYGGYDAETGLDSNQYAHQWLLNEVGGNVTVAQGVGSDYLAAFFPINDTISFQTNHIYYITLISESEVSFQHPWDTQGFYNPSPSLASYVGGSATTYVDPVLTVDPIYASQYHIYGGLLGPPIPAVSSAPEPDLWSLLVAGFGLVGAAVRRRRRVVA